MLILGPLLKVLSACFFPPHLIIIKNMKASIEANISNLREAEAGVLLRDRDYIVALGQRGLQGETLSGNKQGLENQSSASHVRERTRL